MGFVSWALGLNQLLLDFIGIWPNVSIDNKVLAQTKLSKQIRAPSMAGWMLLAIVLPQIYALCFVYGQLTLVVDNVTTSCMVLASSIKLILIWNSRKLLPPIVASVMSDWNKQYSDYEYGVMVKQAARARIFTISGYIIMFFGFVSFLAPPFFGFSIRIINNITDPHGWQRYFPLQTYYPFEQAWNSPIYELLYAAQIIAGSFVGVSFSGADNLFGALVFHASGQCEILKAKLRDLVPRDPQQAELWISKDERNFQKKLGQFVQLHVRLVRFVELIEDSFHTVILAQVLCLSIIMCCLAFGVVTSIKQDSGSPPITQTIILVFTLLNLMIHMLVYCITSEILVEHSSGLSLAVYSSNWYSLPACYSHDIVPVMIRTQHPLQLSAGKFFYLSLNAYLGILKTAAGYVSMLLTVSN